MKSLNEIIKKNLVTIVFLGFLFFMSINYCVSVFIDVFEGTETEETIYSKEFFALQKKLQKSSGTPNVVPTKTLGKKFLDSYRGRTNFLANYNDVLLKDFLLNLNAGLCKSAGMSYIPGTTFIKLEDGMLVALTDGEFEPKKMELNVGYLSNFMEQIKEKGINSVYVECPNKNKLLADEFPCGFAPSTIWDERENMRRLFRENSIPVLDLNEKMNQSDTDELNMFYKTDHHWKVEYGIEAAQLIAEYLNTEANYQIDTKVFDKSNYSVKKYEKCLLGSTGINSTNSFVEADDLDIYVPMEECEYSLEIPSKNLRLRGDFDVFLNKEKLDDKECWPFNAYSTYSHAITSYLTAENKTINDNHKILVIKDSFANAIVPYLSQVVKRVDVVDIRRNQKGHFSESLMSLIEENEYDTVLFIYSSFSYDYDRLYLK